MSILQQERNFINHDFDGKNLKLIDSKLVNANFFNNITKALKK